MSTFNSAAIEEFNGGVWVFCEQRQGTMMPTSFELISEFYEQVGLITSEQLAKVKANMDDSVISDALKAYAAKYGA